MHKLVFEQCFDFFQARTVYVTASRKLRKQNQSPLNFKLEVNPRQLFGSSIIAYTNDCQKSQFIFKKLNQFAASAFFVSIDFIQIIMCGFRLEKFACFEFTVGYGF